MLSDTLPAPVLSLSTSSISKLDDLTLHQLASLWSLFTKCAPSLESGRRLENLSWRLWFREAQLVPEPLDLLHTDIGSLTETSSPRASAESTENPAATTRSSEAAVGEEEEGEWSSETESIDSPEANPPTISASRLGASSARFPTLRAAVRGPLANGEQPLSTRGRTTLEPILSRRPSSSSSDKPREVPPRHIEASRHSISSEISCAALESSQYSRQRRPLSFTAAVADLARDEISNLIPGRALFSDSSQPRLALGRALSADAGQRKETQSRASDYERTATPSVASTKSAPADAGADEGAESKRRESAGALRDERPPVKPNTAVPNQGSAIGPSRSSSRNQASEAGPSTASTSAHKRRPPTTAAARAYRELRKSLSPRLRPSELPDVAGQGTASSPAGQNVSKDPAPAVQNSSGNRPDQQDSTVEQKRKKFFVQPSSFEDDEAMPDARSGAPSGSTSRAEDGFEDMSESSTRVPSPATPVAPRQTAFLEDSQRAVAAVRADVDRGSSVQDRSNDAGDGDEAKSSRASSPAPSTGKQSITSSTRHALHATGTHHHQRNRSGIGLHRGPGHYSSAALRGRAHGRSASGHKPHQPSSKAQGHAKDASADRKGDAAPSTSAVPPSTTEPPRASANEVVTVAPKAQKGKPVTFTMGDDDSDEEDGWEADERPVKAESGGARQDDKTVQQARGPISATEAQVKGEDEDDDDGDWSSDSTVDSAQERKEMLAALKRQEEERQAAMFQKIPVRSQSAADLRHADEVGDGRQGAQGGDKAGDHAAFAAESPPVRGLLSSIFHPEAAPHPPPGQLKGRPHASAADLRHRPFGSGLALSQINTNQQRERSQDTSQAPRVSKQPIGQGGLLPRQHPTAHPVGDNGLRTSKSAVALPVLNMTASRSSTSISSMTPMQAEFGDLPRERPGSSASARSGSTRNDVGTLGSSAGSSAAAAASPESGPLRPSASTAALQRLSQLGSATKRPHSAASLRRKDRSQSRERESTNYTYGEAGPRGPPSPRTQAAELAAQIVVQQESDETPTGSSTDLHLRQRAQAQTGAGWQQLSEQGPSRPTSTGAVPMHRASLPVALPSGALPQTPRTTRRNMLRDELSESIRQNLLWERQSRNRMLGIGAPLAPLPPRETPAQQQERERARQRQDRAREQQERQRDSDSRPPPSAPPAHNRNFTVLGGGPLRPLTSAAPPGATRSRSDHSGLVQQEQLRQQRLAAGNLNMTRGGAPVAQAASNQGRFGSNAREESDSDESPTDGPLPRPGGGYDPDRRSASEWGSFHHKGW
ncbi:Protein of unknown function DUF1752, fungi [Ceraceosorus bombacis]|uniref:Uncharacterized protein n=1 Tax=Ceraceosorus bombacis TaxID=401625 RepID=A0A0P1BKQ8_9BASI|nr:Protein of unknown function DUF1752, fungi [Ceraceosorus bombacis]